MLNDRQIELLCPGCFSPLDQADNCAVCQYSENDPRYPVSLPLKHMLDDRYAVGHIIGKPGEFGITYLCWDTIRRHKVAIKEYLPARLAARAPGALDINPLSESCRGGFDQGLEQFMNEAKMLSDFDHPNIVRIYDIFHANNSAYMVMEHYEGRTLDEKLRSEKGVVNGEIAKNIVLKVLNGLEQLHNKGVLHRDINPRNVFLTRNGEVVLLDFGSARQSFSAFNQGLAGVFAPGYAPIEQYSRQSPQGPWTDMYACGALLYRMATGLEPPDPLEIEDETRSLKLDGIDPVLSGILRKALSQDSNLRPRNAKAFRDMLVSTKIKDIHSSNQTKYPVRDIGSAGVVSEWDSINDTSIKKSRYTDDELVVSMQEQRGRSWRIETIDEGKTSGGMSSMGESNTTSSHTAAATSNHSGNRRVIPVAMLFVSLLLAAVLIGDGIVWFRHLQEANPSSSQAEYEVVTVDPQDTSSAPAPGGDTIDGVKNNDADDPRVLANADMLPGVFALMQGGFFYGELADSTGDSVRPFRLKIHEMNPETGAFTGEVEWIGRNSIHQIQGSISPERLVFTETAYIKEGILGLNYTHAFDVSRLDEGCIKGRWNDANGNPGGSEWIRVNKQPSGS